MQLICSDEKTCKRQHGSSCSIQTTRFIALGDKKKESETFWAIYSNCRTDFAARGEKALMALLRYLFVFVISRMYVVINCVCIFIYFVVLLLSFQRSIT